MSEPSTTEPHSARRIWIAFALLLVAYELAPTVRPRGFALALFRPSLDPLLLLALAWWSRRWPRARAWRALWITWLVALVVFRLDYMIFFLLMRQEPLLYDQLYMLRHAWVLIGDLWSVWMLLALVGVGLGVVGLVYATRWTLSRVFTELDAMPEATVRRRLIAIVGAAAAGFALQSTLWGWSPERPVQRIVRFDTARLATNVARSLRLYRSIRSGLRESPYLAYAEIELTRKPDVRLMLVESYGAIVAEHAELAPWWRARMSELESRLEARGWFMASAYALAPVSGGRSWLAEASIVTGVRVRYEAEFHQVLDRVDEVPNLVSFFAAQGYHTVSLAPADRARAGVPEVNYYGYDQRIDFDDLDFRGQAWGWGIVPDDYSVNMAQHELIDHAAGPLFLDAHLVTSHAPWLRVPSGLHEDWREWRRSDAPPLEPDADREAHQALMTGMRRFKRQDDSKYLYEGEIDELKLSLFRNAIDYEWKVLSQLLEGLEGDSFVVVMGDHQPPLVTPETANFAVPVHVFARDPALLSELRELGFVGGLVLEPAAAPIVSHQGLLSLFVRNFAACCSDIDTDQLPPLLPEGVSFEREAPR